MTTHKTMKVVTIARLIVLAILVGIVVTSIALAHAESPDAGYTDVEVDDTNIIEETARFSYFDDIPQLEWDEISNATGVIVQIGDDAPVRTDSPTTCMRFSNVPPDAEVNLTITTDDGNYVIYNDVLPTN